MSSAGPVRVPVEPPNPEWAQVRLGRIGAIQYGASLALELDGKGVPFVRATDVFRGKIATERLQRVRLAQPGRLRRLKGGDIVVVRSGAYAGDSALVPGELEGAVLGYDMRLRVHGALPQFVAWTLLSDYVLERQILPGRGRAAQPHVNAEELGACKILLPPRPKQRGIADFLDRETAYIDDLIEKKERLISLLEEKRSALITRAVTKSLDPDVSMKDSGVEWIGEIPGHWEMCPIRHLSTHLTSGSRGWASYYADDGAVFLRIGNVSGPGVSLDLTDVVHVRAPSSKEAERSRVQAGDILLSITALVGASAVVPRGFPESYVNQHLALIRPRTDQIVPDWLALFLQSRRGQALLRILTYGGTKEGLSLDDVRGVAVPVPPIPEQRAIVAELKLFWSAAQEVIHATGRSISLLKERRSALITAAVTGQIDVSEYAA